MISKILWHYFLHVYLIYPIIQRMGVKNAGY
jgi:hypothetical protein